MVRAGAPLSARELPALLERVHDALTERRDVLDDLNVFPVPDGDTGTNMVLTLRSSLQALNDVASAAGAERSREVIRGAVRGARGNSGVILSQVIRAVVEELTGRPHIDGGTYAAALEHASTLAYEAVAEPVEGTILTAIRAAADAARAASDEGLDLHEVSARTCAAVAAAVEDTPTQLAVLRAAGVVDAGARGFEVVLAAVHGHLCGEAPPVRLDEPRHLPRRQSGKGCHVSLANPFEVQYLLDAPDDRAAVVRRDLESLGDSVVVVGAGGLLNVHVHTAAIGSAIEVGLDHGRPSNIQVTHLGEQVASRETAGWDVPDLGAVAAVAVLSGSGAIELADAPHVEVVDGAAGRLPSVADLLDGIDRTAAQVTLVLPGHRNALAAAQQAADEAQRTNGRKVVVIDAAVTPPAVLAGLAVLDPGGDAATVASEVAEAAAAVRVGEVVAATRAADTSIGSISAGQPLAVVGGEVVAVQDQPLDALREVATQLHVDKAEIVTVLIGGEVDDDERRLSIELVQELAPDAELEVIDARQRPTRYWVGVE